MKSFVIEEDLKKLKGIRKHVPLMNVSQIDIIWLVSALQYYIMKCKDLKENDK